MSNQSKSPSWMIDFKQYKDLSAIVWEARYYSYSYLEERIEFWEKRITNILGGEIVALESDFTPETVALLFALIKRKAIIVPLDISQSENNAHKLKIAQAELLIRVGKNESIEFHELDTPGEKNRLFKIISDRGIPGLILFTSGSSGEPKAALHDFSKLLKKFETKRKALRTINFLLFDHWGGLNTLFHVLSNGGTVVFLENRNPDYVCELIENYKVELLPASPTFLNMLLLSKAYKRKSLQSLKIISYGAEPMPENLLRTLNELFPDIAFHQTYGLIELGVMRSKSQSNGSLLVKIGGEGFNTRVVEGILQIKSDSAMLGYLNAPSPFTEDGWFITGDSVEENGEYLKILGRKSEIINVGGEKVFPQEVENVIIELPFIQDVLVYGESNPLTGKIVCAKIKYESTETHSDIVKQIKIYCRSKLASFKVPVKIIKSETDLNNNRFKKTRING